MAESLTREGLIQTLHEGLRLPKYRCREVINIIIAELAEALIQNRRVELRGFGTFEPRIRPPRKARNFRTGEMIRAPAKRYIRFRPGLRLKKALRFVSR